MHRVFFLILLVFFGLGCGAEDGPDPSTGAVISASDLVGIELVPGIQTVTVGQPPATLLRLTIAVPDTLPEAGVPLVLALHWAGSDSPHLAETYVTTFAEPALRNLGAIIIAPEATSTYWAGPVVSRTLSSLVTSALTVWPVDPEQVALTGYSMGGVGAWYMASVYPDLFSATIPVAGLPTAVLEPEVPLLAIHGELDSFHPLAFTQTAVDSLIALGGLAELVVVPGATHGDVALHAPYLTAAIDWLHAEVWGNGSR